MILSGQNFDQLLPAYLHETTKRRIDSALSQFETDNEIDYSDFFSHLESEYLMQSDVVSSIKGIEWDEVLMDYMSGFNPAVLISNTCDIFEGNVRAVNPKEALFAPIIPLNEYIKDCKEEGYTDDQLISFKDTLIKQKFTNLFYLPPNYRNNKAYIVRLDKIYWSPASQVNVVTSDLKGQRYLSLSQWGFYLFLVKLSVHICRAPEEIEERSSN
jgi:hypothetical protein